MPSRQQMIMNYRGRIRNRGERYALSPADDNEYQIPVFEKDNLRLSGACRQEMPAQKRKEEGGDGAKQRCSKGISEYI